MLSGSLEHSTKRKIEAKHLLKFSFAKQQIYLYKKFHSRGTPGATAHFLGAFCFATGMFAYHEKMNAKSIFFLCCCRKFCFSVCYVLKMYFS